MPTPRYFITQWNTYPAQEKLALYYRDAVSGGSNLYVELTENQTPLDDPAYTNDDICAALAAALGVDPTLVAMDPVPEVPAEEPEEEPA